MIEPALGHELGGFAISEGRDSGLMDVSSCFSLATAPIEVSSVVPTVKAQKLDVS